MSDHRLAPTILHALGLGMGLVLTAGCLPVSGPHAAYKAPVMDAATAAEAAVLARMEYEKNRPEPPRNFQVPPRPPRDNGFGEFRDDLFLGIDAQPELPPLPVDSTPSPPMRDRGTRQPMAASFPNEGGGPTPSNRPARPPERQGIDSGGHFYPIEQLVYGGDYPDIDKPELYRLMPKDVITVTVRDHPEFSGQMEIQPDGTIRVPSAPDLVRLRGLTAEEAANAVKQTLSPYIRGEAMVRVQANRARGGYYFVFGEVLQPGRFPMGLEPIKLSEAVLAANWEANPARRDIDGEELGPAFPAASPRGKFTAPRTADLARVALVTPHRSQPVRSVHDVRSALLGVTANDPPIRPGQIIVVPSLVPERNRDLGGLAPAGETTPGQGFSTARTSTRLPETAPFAVRRADAAGAAGWVETLPVRPQPPPESLVMSPVETNMAGAYLANRDIAGSGFDDGITVERPATIPTVKGPIREEPPPDPREATAAGQPWPRRKVIRRQRAENPVREPAGTVPGWKKGL